MLSSFSCGGQILNLAFAQQRLWETTSLATAFFVLVISFKQLNNPLSCSFFDTSSMCFAVALNSTLLILTLHQIIHNSFTYGFIGSDFNLIFNLPEFWWLENGLAVFLLIFYASPSSIASAMNIPFLGSLNFVDICKNWIAFPMIPK